MTVWKRYEPKGNVAPYYQPRRHLPEKQMWRDFSNLVISDQENRTPGVLEWVAWLKDKKMIDKNITINLGIGINSQTITEFLKENNIDFEEIK